MLIEQMEIEEFREKFKVKKGKSFYKRDSGWFEKYKKLIGGEKNVFNLTISAVFENSSEHATEKSSIHWVQQKFP